MSADEVANVDLNLVIMVIAAVLAAIVVLCLIVSLVRKKHARERALGYMLKATVLTSEEFFDLYDERVDLLRRFDFVGCYVLTNTTRNISYVGRGTHVPQRIRKHLLGKGNARLFEDYMQGDEFEVRMQDIAQTDYKRLDDMRRDLIAAYDSYRNGYNETKG